jgi:hypothetical protein
VVGARQFHRIAEIIDPHRSAFNPHQSTERESPVANKAKSSKVSEKDRRARVEAMRREQLAKERRKSLIFVTLAVLVGAGLVVAAALPAYLHNRNDPAKKTLSSFGVSAAEASCSAVQTTKATNKLVPTGANGTWHFPDGTVEKYKTVPPSFGPHWATPVLDSRAFYSVKDRPEMEQLVHNLEHGYTIVWYDKSITGDQLSALKDLSTSARSRAETAPAKFIVSAWDNAYGHFPAGKHIGISHWGAKDSHTQLCGKVSGEVVTTFIKNYPASDSPEPTAA